MLADAGRSVMVVPEMMLERHLTQNRMLVLAACEYLKPSTEKLIRKFVAEGGTVLVSDSLPVLDNDSVPVWLGINSRERYHV